MKKKKKQKKKKKKRLVQWANLNVWNSCTCGIKQWVLAKPIKLLNLNPEDMLSMVELLEMIFCGQPQIYSWGWTMNSQRENTCVNAKDKIMMKGAWYMISRTCAQA